MLFVVDAARNEKFSPGCAAGLHQPCIAELQINSPVFRTPRNVRPGPKTEAVGEQVAESSASDYIKTHDRGEEREIQQQRADLEGTRM